MQLWRHNAMCIIFWEQKLARAKLLCAFDAIFAVSKQILLLVHIPQYTRTFKKTYGEEQVCWGISTLASTFRSEL